MAVLTFTMDVKSLSWESYVPDLYSELGEAEFLSKSVHAHSLSPANTLYNDTTGIICPEDIALYTDLNSCVAVINAGLNVTDPNGIISTLSWEMTGATEATSNGFGINQIGSYTFNEGTTVVTYRGATLYNNSINCTFTVTVTDDQAPRLISSPGHITVRNLPGECYANVSWTEPSAVDNCVPQNQLIYTGNYSSGQQFPVGSTRVEYRISDGVNTAFHSFTVTVIDAEAPEMIAPPAMESECGKPVPDAFTTWEQFEQAGGSANDNCSVNYGSFRYVGQTSSGITCPYTVTRIYSISDNDGNVSEVKHVIEVTGEGMAYEATVEATEPEVLLEPGAETQAEILFSKTDVSCKGSRTGVVDLTVNGTSGIVSFVWSTQNGSGIVQGAEDQSTLSDGDYTVMVYEDGIRLLTFDFSILVVDNQAPVLNAPENIQRNCGQYIPAAYSTWSDFANAGGTVSDNCQIYYSSFRLASEAKSNPDCPYTLARVYEITDVNGNRGVAEHLITVEADEVVLKSGMADCTASSGNWSNPAIWSCGNVPTSSDNVIIPNGVTVTVDAAAVANNITIESGGELNHGADLSTTVQVYGDWTNNGTYDGGTNGVVEFTGPGSASINGTTDFEGLIVNKDDGLSSELTINGGVNVLSSGLLTMTSGLITIPGGSSFSVNPSIGLDIEYEAGFDVTGGSLVTGDFTITNEGLIRIAAGSNVTLGDDSGNEVHTQFDGAFIVTGGDVDIAGRLYNSASGTLDPDGLNLTSGITISSGTVTLCTLGNKASSTGSLQVTSAGNFEFSGGTIVFQNPSTATSELDLGLIDGTGTKNIINGTFQFGNENTPDGSIFYIDSEIKIPHIDTYLGSALFLAMPVDGASIVECIDQATEPTPPEVIDNCGYVAVPTGPVINENFDGCEGTKSYTYTYEDCDGSTHDWVYTYTIDDNTNPTATAPTTVDLECANDLPSAATTIAGFLALTGSDAADNCTAQANLTVSSSDATTIAGSCSGEITRTYRITDECGNWVEVDHVFTVTDNENPTATAPTTVDLECADDLPLAAATITDFLNLAGAAAADNCTATANLTVTSNDVVSTAGSCNGVITRTYTITDGCGNSVNVDHVFTVTDNESPTASAPSTVDLECADDLPAAATTIAGFLSLTGADAADNCTAQANLVVTSVDNTTGAGSCSGEITRTYTITDGCGNTVDVDHVFTVTDDTNPTASAPSTVDLECADDLPLAAATITDFLNLAGAAAADNCTATANLTVTSNDVVSTTGSCNGIITRTYTITDGCGNSVNVDHVFTVTDNESPTASAPSTVDLECADDLPAAATTIAGFLSLTGADAADNCTAQANLVVTSVDNTTGAGSCSGEITRTYTITDGCGNTVDVDHVFTVTDDTNPTASAPSTVDLECADDLPLAAATITDFLNLAGAAAADNCTATANLTVTSNDVVSTTGSCNGIITRTYTITDGCGNSVNVDHVFTVTDDTNPTASAPSTVDLECADDLPAAATTIAGFLSLTGADAADNCTAQANLVVTSVDNTTGAGSCSGEITRTYTITDGCGNTVDVDHVFTVTDDTNPTASAPSTVDLECADDLPLAAATITDFLNLAGAAAADNCTATANLTVTSNDVVSTTGSCNGIITRTYTITDGCGNSVNVDHVFTVTDDTNPTASAPSTVDLECADDLPAAATTIAGFLSLTGADAADNCTAQANLVVTSVDNTTGAGSCSGEITRTYTITDGCGNTVDVDHVFTVTDDTNPTASAPSTVDLECADDLPLAAATITDFLNLAGAAAADNCTATANLTVTSNDVVSTTGSCNGIITRTYTITDGCGNSVNVDHVFTVTDNESPTASAPSTVDLECADDLPAAATTIAGFLSLTGADAADNCTAQANLVVTSVDNTTGAGSCSGEITRTYTITDGCGNTVDVDHVFTVTDDTNPTASAPSTVDLECADDLPLAAATITDFLNLAGAAAADNCTATANLTVTSNDVVSTTGSCNGIITRTYTITDGCGNSVNVDHVFTVTDNESPTASAPSTVDLECADDLPAAATTIAGFLSLTGADAADNCTAQANLVVTSVDNTTGAGSCSGEITRTYTITDGCGNTVDVDHVFTVTDDTNPTASAPSIVDLECADDLPLAAATITDFLNLAGAAAADNCTATANLTVTSNDVVSTAGSCNGVITRTYTITDECGNTVDVEHVFTVTDDTNPTATAPTTVDLECANDLPLAAATITDFLNLAGAAAADNCTATANLTVTSNDVVSTTGSCNGIITRTYTITDGCGNSVNVDHVFTVTDNESPTASAPSTVDLECADDLPAAATTIAGFLSLTGADAADNCTAQANLVVTSVDNTTGAGSCSGEITRTYTITDGCGNTVDVDHVFTVTDDTNPTASAPLPINVECVTDVPASDITVVTDEADNCTANPVVAFVSDVSDGGFNPEIITRTYSVTDDCGNSINVEQIITIDDVTPPDAQCQPKTIQLDASGNASITIADIDNGSSDNCTAVENLVFALDKTDFTCVDLGSNSVVLTVTDEHGNSSTCNATVTVEDKINPTITCIASYTATGNSACTGIINVVAPSYADNCGVTAVNWTMTGATNDYGSGAIGTYTFSRGTTTIEYTVADAAGNEAKCSYQITIPDLLTTTASSDPVICEGDNLTLSSTPTGGTPNYTYSWSGPNGYTSTQQNPVINNVAPAASGNYSVTVTDNNNCTATASVSVTVRPTPTATISGTTAVCQNEAPAPSVTFTNEMAEAVVVTFNINGGTNTTLDISGNGSRSVSQPTGTAGTYVYNLVEVRYASGVVCPNTNPSSATITVHPTPTVNPINNVVYCNGQTVGSLLPTGPVEGTTFTWENNNTSIGLGASGNGSVSAFTATNSTDDPISADITITPFANGCEGTPYTYTITVNPTPRATITGTTTVCYEDTEPVITFINPTGLALTVAYNINGSGTTYTIDVEANSTATITAPTTTPGTFNYNLVSAAYQSSPNCLIGITGTATVTVDPEPIADATPQNQTICSGEDITTIILGTTNGISGTTFSWRRNNNVSVTGMAENGTGNISGALTNTTASPVTVTFYITPEAAGCPGAEIEARVIVNPIPVATITDNNGSRCSGVKISEIVLSSTTPNTTFTWTRDNTDIVSGIPESGSGSAINGALTNLTSAPVPVTFTVTPTANGCEGLPVTTIITINPTPQINDTTLTICNSGSFDATPVDVINGVVPVGTSYDWNIQSNTGGVTGAVDGDGTSITGILGNSTNTVQTVTYAVYPRFSGCLGDVFLVKVNVTPEPDIDNMTASACSNQGFTVKPVNATNGIVPSGTQYTWSAPFLPAGLIGGTENTTPASSITGTLINTTKDPLTATYTVSPSNGICSGADFEVVVTVNPAATVNASEINACSGSGFSFAPEHGVDGAIVPDGTTYSWSAPDMDAGVSGGTAGSGASVISGTLFNSASSPLEARYTVTPFSAGCAGDPFVLTVTVDPLPAINPIPKTICSGEPFTITPEDGTNGVVPAGTTYSWAAPTVTGGITGGQAGTDQSEISGTLTNPTNAPRTATYTVTPTSGSCAGIVFSVIVTVNPTPAITEINTTVCSGGAFSITPQNGVNGIVPSGTTYTWIAPDMPSDVSGGVANATPSADINGTLTNSSGDAQVVTYVVSASSGTCGPTTFNVNVTVNPTPTASISGGGTVCDNAGTANIIFTNPMDLPVTVTYNIDGGTNLTVDIAANDSETVPATINQTGTFIYNLESVAYQSSPDCSTSIADQSVTLVVEPVTTAAISADNTTICEEDLVTFTADIANAGTNPTLVWKVNNVTEQTGGTTFTSQTLSNGDEVTFEITTTAGTSCLGTTISNTVTMTVNPLNVPSVSIYGSATNICEGTSVTFTIDEVINGGPTPGYQWYVNGVLVSGATNTTFTSSTLADGDRVTVVVSSSASCPGPDATSNEVVMTVNTKQIVEVSVAADNNAVCEGTAVTYTATPANGGLVPSYQWYVNGLPIGPNSDIYTYNPSPGDVVTVELTSSETCVEDPTATSAPLSVTVEPAPTATAGGNATICFNETYTLKASDAEATNYSAISWTENGNGSITVGANTLTPTYTPGAGDEGTSVVLTMTATGSGSCSSQSVQATFTVNIDPLPTAFAGGSTTICSNSNVTVSGASASNGTILWTISNGNGTLTNATTLTPTYIADPADEGTTVTLNMEVTSNKGCGTANDTYTINIDPVPTVTISEAATAICSDETFTMPGGGANATNYNTIEWTTSNGAGNISDANTLAPTYTPVAGDEGKDIVLTLTATGTGECGTTTASADYTLTVNPLITPGVSISADMTEACIADIITFTATPESGAGSSPTYQWKVNGADIVGETTSIFTTSSLADGDIVSVEMTSSLDCADPVLSNEIPVTIISSAPPQPGFISGLSAICPALTTTYSIDPVDGAIDYTWTVPSQWNIDAGQGTTSITVTFPLGDLNADISVVANNVCGPSAASILNVNVASTASVYAGPDQTICVGTSVVNLNGVLTGAVRENKKEEWDWEVLDGGNLGQDKLATTYSYLGGFPVGTYRVVLKSNVTAVGCDQVSDTMLVTVLPEPTLASVTSNGPICEGETAVVSITATPNTAITYNIDGGANQTIDIGASGIATITTAVLSSNTTYNFTNIAYPNLSSCENNITESLTITVNQLPTVDAGSPQTICSNTTATLAGVISGDVSAGTWSGGTGAYSTNANDLNAQYTPSAAEIAAGSVTLTLTSDDPAGPCGPVSDDVVITIEPAPTVEAGGPDVICESDSPDPIVLTGASIGGGANTGTWSIVSGGGTLSSTTPEALPATVTYTPQANWNGTVTLKLTSDATAGCLPVSDTRTITIEPTLTVEAGEPIDACESASPTAITLSGATFGGGANTAAWYISSGLGTLSNTNQTANPETVTLTPAPDFRGDIVLTLTTDQPGACPAATDTRTITVNPAPTVEAGGPDDVCESSSPNSILLSGASIGGGATQATWSITTGSGTLSNNSPTASPETVTFTPDADFHGNVTLTLTTEAYGACPVVSDTRDITIYEAVTVDPGSYAAICSNETIALNGTISGGVTTGTWTGGGGTFSTNNRDLFAAYTPSGAEIAAGSVTLTLISDDPAGQCGAVSESTTITIYRKVTITSQPVNTGVCVGNPATLSVTASGSNLSYQWYKNGAIIDGATSPTLSFPSVSLTDEALYYVIVSGESECASVQSTEVTLNVDAAITITTQPSSKTRCEGENVIFTVVAGANGAVLTYQWRKDGVNISGATSSSYTINNVASGDAGVYDVVIDGAGSFNCNSITSAAATLTIGSDGTISDPASKDQTICEGNAITDIVFAIGGSADGAILSGSLPAGLTSGYNSSTKEFTISGTPTETGTYNYTLTTTGSTCVNPSISGTLTINTDGTISLAGGNATPTLCINNPLPTISYSIGGSATGASITAGSLPAGVTGVYSSTNGLFTISGTPTEDGTFNFTVTTSGAACDNPSLSGTITVQPDATISLDSGDPNQTVCINTPIAPINYSGGGSAGTLVLTGQLPAGVSFTQSGGVYTISGTPSVAGTFNYTVNTTGSCLNVSESGSITIDNLADPGILSPAISTACTDENNENSGTLTLIDYVGSIVQWEASYDGGQTWEIIPHTGASYTYNNLPNTTLFTVLVQNGSCDPFYSAIARVTVIPPFTPLITQEGGNACSGEPVTLYGTVDVITEEFSIITGGLFNTANPKGWRIWQDGVILSPFPASGDNEKATPWAETNGPKQFCGTDYDSGEKKFSIVMGEPGVNMNSWMETPIFELLSTMSSAELNFDHAYDLAPGATAKVEISLDGGDTYNTILASYTGTLNTGMPNVVNPIEIDLSPYIGMDNLRIRFNFDSNNECGVWAIDNITLPAPPPDVTYVWGPVEEIPLGVTGSPVVVYPGTSTTYTLTMYIAGCPGSATEQLVYVYEYPVVQTVNACVGGGDVTFTMTEATEGGTWTVSGGGTITNDGVFTPTTPGCYVATYETPEGGCTGSANFVVFPEAPTPTVNTGCGPIVVTPPPTIDGFNIEYNFGDGNGWRQQNIPPTAHNCTPGYSIQVRYVTADLCDPTPVGNVSENMICSESPAVIRPIDLNPPTFTVPADISISKDANCNYDASVGVTGDVTDEADDCATTGLNATYSDVVLPGDCEGEEIITRTWTLADDCGNTTTKKQTITVLDNEEPPTFTVPANITIYKDASCNYDASPAKTGDVTDESDNCSTGLEALYSDDVSTADNCGAITITRTWTLTDNCGNVTSQDQIITVLVNIPPVIICPADITVECIDDVPEPDINAVAVTDICGQVTIAFEGDVSDENTCPEIITRTYKATDVCGLYSVTCTQRITVDDTTAPVISSPTNKNIEACDVGPAIASGGFLPYSSSGATITLAQLQAEGGNASDNCSLASVSYIDVPSGSCPWVVTRTFTATDACGNEGTATQTFTIDDTTPPVISIPEDRNIQGCDMAPALASEGLLPYSPSGATITLDQLQAEGGDASDNCSLASISYIDVTTGSCPWTVSRNFSATDACGNVTTSTQTFVITIDDTTPPVVTAGADQTIEACSVLAGLPSYSETPVSVKGQEATYGFTVTEDCAYDITYVDVTTSSCPWIVTRTFTATDGCGNSGTATQTFTIDDTTVPVFSPEASNGVSDCDDEDPSANADFLNWLADHGGARATDNCDTDMDWTNNSAGQPWVRSGIDNTITVTFTVTDDCGNSAETTASFTVSDDVPPTLTCPVSSDASNPDLFEDFVSGDGCSKQGINVPNPAIDDACGIDRLVYTLSGATTGSSSSTGINYVSEAELNVGITTVTYTLYDIAGNSAECSIRIWIKNIDEPRFTVSCPDATASDISVFAEADLCDAEVTVPAPVIDNFCVESFTVSYQIDGGTSVSVTPPPAVGTVTTLEELTERFEVGTHTVTWTIVDASGNVYTCVINIAVTDDQLPTITCPTGPFELEVPVGECDVQYNDPNLDPVYSDACTDVTLTYLLEFNNGDPDQTGTGSVNGFTFPDGITTVTYTVTDEYNNSVSCSFEVISARVVIPEEAYECPESPAPVDADPVSCDAWVDVAAPVITDPCDAIESVTNDYNGTGNASDTYPIGETLVTWTIKEYGGTVTYCTQTVIVNDVSDPQLICPTGPFELEVPVGECDVQYNDPNLDPVYSDVCTDVTLTYLLEFNNGDPDQTGTGSVNGFTFPDGITTVTYTVTDEYNNSVSCSFEVISARVVIPEEAYECPESPAPVDADPVSCDAWVDVAAPVISDPCDAIESVTNDYNGTGNASDRYPVGETLVTWTIKEYGGTEIYCTQTVIVNDVSDPQLTCPTGPFELEVPVGECDVQYNDPNLDPVYSDVCTDVTLTYLLEFNNGDPNQTGTGSVNGFTFPDGVTTVTYTVTDEYNNSVSCSFEVISARVVIPEEAYECPVSPAPVPAEDGECDAWVDVAAPVISDPCDAIESVTNNYNGTGDASDRYPVGETLVTWTIREYGGTETYCYQTVIVTDLPPFVVCPPDIEVQADYDLPYQDDVTGLAPLDWGDNCPDPVLSWELTPPVGYESEYDVSELTGLGEYPSPNTFYIGETTIKYIVTDRNGNTADCSFTITVKGPPVITCPPTYEAPTDQGVCTATLNSTDHYGLPVLEEGVQPITWTWTITNPNGTEGATGTFVASVATPGPPDIGDYPFEVGTSTISWRAENISGFDECEHLVIVTDKEPPVITADPYENCVDPLHWATYNESDPTPQFGHVDPNLIKSPIDYRTLIAGDTDLDLTSLTDNCCDSLSMISKLQWRIEFANTPDPITGVALSHPDITGQGQPSDYAIDGVPKDIYLWGDGVTFKTVTHNIFYWIEDCNGNPVTEELRKEITITPRPQVIKTDY
ncbi:PKD-like domain-containing protein [Draconibacterium orientale]|uniref:HYR-like domain-containing protein n=1 Tax=Draconibacterium orientale TaxID=1168034 RepID=UPI002A0A6E21|nr:PKD-like domain-containing protein [Draconibacterium orientale]